MLMAIACPRPWYPSRSCGKTLAAAVEAAVVAAPKPTPCSKRLIVKRGDALNDSGQCCSCYEDSDAGDDNE